MQGIKVCFVCGRDHYARTLHIPEEVTAAVNKLKSKHPYALLTVEDIQHVVKMRTEYPDDHDEDSGETMCNEEEDRGE